MSSSKKSALSQLGVALIFFFFLSDTYAKPYTPFNPGWDDSNISAAFEPGNRRGHNPVYSTSSVQSTIGFLRQSLDDGGVGSANFQLTVPVVNLAGRGLNLSLALHYNSRVWNKAETMIFDIDGEWPAPGWSLGFGKLVQGILFDPDGTRHNFKRTSTTPSNSQPVFQATDGSLIEFSYSSTFTHCVVRYPNGKVVDFETKDSSAPDYYPTKVTDANGNFITITYRSNTGPQIETITDTMGRIIRFYYDQNNLLTAVEGPSLYSGTPRTLIRLHYRMMKLNYDFSPALIDKECPRCPKPDISAYLIDAIYYPGTKTGYWFGDSDSFSGYGMLRKVTEQREMGFTASSSTEQGNIIPGIFTRQREYNYPIHPVSTLRDAPAYDKMTETWESMDTPPAITSYLIDNDSSPRRTEVTYPDGSSITQFSHNNPKQFNDGLVYFTVVDNGNLQLLSKVNVDWEKGEDGVPRVHRVERSDGKGNPAAVEYSYSAEHNALTEVREYDYDGVTVLRKATTEYESDPGYSTQHIFNLPKVMQIYQGNSRVPASRTEYAYDSNPLASTPGIIAHLVKNHYRGNLTSLKRYADAEHLTGAITESRNYDTAGNLVSVSKAPGEQTRFNFNSQTQYAYPNSISQGAPGSNSPWDLTTSIAYDFNTGLVSATTDVNGRSTLFSYFNYPPFTLLPRNTVWPTGAKTEYEYDLQKLANTQTIFNSAGLVMAKNVNRLNGIGLLRRAESLADGQQYDILETKYDAMGRHWQQSQPFREGQQPKWDKTKYDGLGRITEMSTADGSLIRYFYNVYIRPSEASQTPGQTTRMVDAWGRERWSRTNALGQLAEVVEPNPYGDGSLLVSGQVITTYLYNAFDQVERIDHAQQHYQFRYDSLGRLTHQYLPEKNRTLDWLGGFDGSHGSQGDEVHRWSGVFAYDERSNLTSHIDARGVKTKYVYYDNDPLNRLSTVTYDLTGFGDTGNPVLPAQEVQYQYIWTGDVRKVFRMITPGIGIEENAYDGEGRLSSRKYTIEGHPRYPLTVGYSYDDLSRISDNTYPMQYGATNPASKILHYDFGLASQLKLLRMNGLSYASDFVYNAAGQVTSLNIGADGSNQIIESRDFDTATGLMTGLRISRQGASLLDLSYNYLPNIIFGHNRNQGITGKLTVIINNSDRSKDQAFIYDSWGRLQQLQFGEWHQEYNYDNYGNRSGINVFGHPAHPCPINDPNCIPPSEPKAPPELYDGLKSVSYDATTNRISLPGFKYDAAGNLTRSLRADGTWQRYQYDAAGRLARVFDDNGVTAERYSYEGASNKRLITQYGEPSRKFKFYVWEGNSVIAEYEKTNDPVQTNPKWTRSYTYLGDRLLATILPNEAGTETVQFHHPGHLGTRVITDSSTGRVINQETFPFGTEMPGSSSEINKPFTSYDRSKLTKLDYAVNRYYDSYLGRFTQPDPLGMGAVNLLNPQSLNMYAYVENDPVNGTDSTGLLYTLSPEFRVCVLGQCSDGGSYGGGGGINGNFLPSKADLGRECDSGNGIYNSCREERGEWGAYDLWENQKENRENRQFEEAFPGLLAEYNAEIENRVNLTHLVGNDQPLIAATTGVKWGTWAQFKAQYRIYRTILRVFFAHPEIPPPPPPPAIIRTIPPITGPALFFIDFHYIFPCNPNFGTVSEECMRL